MAARRTLERGFPRWWSAASPATVPEAQGRGKAWPGNCTSGGLPSARGPAPACRVPRGGHVSVDGGGGWARAWAVLSWPGARSRCGTGRFWVAHGSGVRMLLHQPQPCWPHVDGDVACRRLSGLAEVAGLLTRSWHVIEKPGTALPYPDCHCEYGVSQRQLASGHDLLVNTGGLAGGSVLLSLCERRRGRSGRGPGCQGRVGRRQ